MGTTSSLVVDFPPPDTPLIIETSKPVLGTVREPAEFTLQSLQNDVKDLRSHVMCQICVRPMFEPYTIFCGHSFCYSCISQWFESNRRRKTCPECRAKVFHPPAPAYMLREIVQLFVQRQSLLGDGESLLDHKKQQEEEASSVEQDKANKDPKTGGLFRGCFRDGDSLRHRPLPDHSDNVLRCISCGWELVDNYCGNCDVEYDRFSDDGSDSDIITMEMMSQATDEDAFGGPLDNDSDDLTAHAIEYIRDGDSFDGHHPHDHHFLHHHHHHHHHHARPELWASAHNRRIPHDSISLLSTDNEDNEDGDDNQSDASNVIGWTPNAAWSSDGDEDGDDEDSSLQDFIDDGAGMSDGVEGIEMTYDNDSAMSDAPPPSEMDEAGDTNSHLTFGESINSIFNSSDSEAASVVAGRPSHGTSRPSGFGVDGLSTRAPRVSRPNPTRTRPIAPSFRGTARNEDQRDRSLAARMSPVRLTIDDSDSDTPVAPTRSRKRRMVVESDSSEGNDDDDEDNTGTGSSRPRKRRSQSGSDTFGGASTQTSTVIDSGRSQASSSSTPRISPIGLSSSPSITEEVAGPSSRPSRTRRAAAAVAHRIRGHNALARDSVAAARRRYEVVSTCPPEGQRPPVPQALWSEDEDEEEEMEEEDTDEMEAAAQEDDAEVGPASAITPGPAHRSRRRAVLDGVIDLVTPEGVSTRAARRQQKRDRDENNQRRRTRLQMHGSDATIRAA
ncbi:hypothetical protein MMC25_007618 [Agyrium rufum]|nr:hypothetical protein [Agyrium rufum]